jgi:hypothetical protein
VSNGNLPSRVKRTTGALGAAAAITAFGFSAAAGPAQASPYATGWQCISPFANFTNSTYPNDPPAPNGILDSLAIGISRPGGEALTAAAGQPLPLRDLQLGLSFKDPRVAEQLYTRTGGVSLVYTGKPVGQPSAITTARTLSRTTVGAGTIAATSINVGGTAPVAGQSWWTFAVSNVDPASPAYQNSGWFSDGAPNASGKVTRTYYVEAVSGSAPPHDNAGGFIAAAPSVGHKYVTHTGNNHFPINAWVVLEGTNTVERTQTVHVQGVWTIRVEDSTPGSLADPSGYADGGHTVTVPDVSLNLPRSNWTPTGAGSVEFRIAGPGNASPVQIESKGYDRPGYNRPVTIKPFGSVIVRADTEAYGATNDCIPGAIGIQDATIAASFWGNGRPDATAANPDRTIGSPDNPGFVLDNAGTGWNPVKGAAGRYSFAAAPQPALAVAPLAAVTTPTPVPPKPYVAKAAKLTATSLKKSKANTVTLKIANPNAKAAKFKVAVRTTTKYKLGKGSSKLQTVVAGKTVTVAAGKTQSAALKLTSAAKSLLKARKSLKVKITITPTDGKLAKSVSKTVTLKR